MKNHEQEKIFDIRVSFLNSVFGHGVRSADSYAVTCPSCCGTPERQHKKKLSIKLVDGMHHCWICGLKGKTLQYTIKKFHPARLSEYLRIFEEEDYKSKVKVPDDDFEEIVELPKSFMPLATCMPDDPDHVAVIRYLFSRGLNRQDFYRWRLGTCTSGKFRRKVIMPSFDGDGELNYFTARSIDSDGAKKYINSKVKRKNVVFNELNIRWDEPLTLVEGPFDLTKCNWNATAMLGSYLDESYLLFKKIVQNSTDVVLAMDTDAEDKKIKLAKKLISYGINVKSINLNTFNDVGEMSKRQFTEALNGATAWSSAMTLKTKIRKIRSSSFFR